MAPPKPKPLKKDRPNRKRKAAVRKKDHDFQKAGESVPCIVCGKPGSWHHRKGRRHIKTRWDTANCIRLCIFHHNAVHSLGEEAFCRTYNLTLPPL